MCHRRNSCDWTQPALDQSRGPLCAALAARHRHTTMGRVATTSSPVPVSVAAPAQPSADATCPARQQQQREPNLCRSAILLSPPARQPASQQLPHAANAAAAIQRRRLHLGPDEAACFVPSSPSFLPPSMACATQPASRRRLVRIVSPRSFMRMLASAACLVNVSFAFSSPISLCNISAVQPTIFPPFSPLLSEPPALHPLLRTHCATLRPFALRSLRPTAAAIDTHIHSCQDNLGCDLDLDTLLVFDAARHCAAPPHHSYPSRPNSADSLNKSLHHIRVSQTSAHTGGSWSHSAVGLKSTKDLGRAYHPLSSPPIGKSPRTFISTSQLRWLH